MLIYYQFRYQKLLSLLFPCLFWFAQDSYYSLKKKKCKPICTAEQPYDQDPVEKYNTNGTAEQPYDQDPVRNVISSRTAEQLYDKDPVEIFDPGYLTRLGNN